MLESRSLELASYLQPAGLSQSGNNEGGSLREATPFASFFERGSAGSSNTNQDATFAFFHSDATFPTSPLVVA